MATHRPSPVAPPVPEDDRFDRSPWGLVLVAVFAVLLFSVAGMDGARRSAGEGTGVRRAAIGRLPATAPTVAAVVQGPHD